MTGRTALPISMLVVFLALTMGMPQAAAQTVDADEAYGAPARLAPHVALSPAQKRAIYTAVSRQRLRTSAANIPLTVGATVPRATALLALPDVARIDDLSIQDLKYATVDDNVVVVDPTTMRVIDIIRSAGR